ncbi:TPA: AlpA family phage regulatory protein [Pseudomonas aeruginosa]|uniref:helix-turn-helix transcriptional regulator n=1 Tax=Pseudomonas aeruginosa TaxID=287 RepID=UPI00106868BA|nr:AlpA family phage regulatory protein [Pseudomonas aeruginosa]EMC9463215.1 AlpA family phage regulatory protein [Pseudomonas aeruginosa]MCS9014594.1 AlpA family phage regulatory protein [Pseudomonas aeruginosa]TED73291.1 AlpA family phage regulatory protein [Pseudomonas aeruginosa]HEJ2559259.1 AlpA family phage regulatory protein [Pseudomonas aeruginosa]
MASTTTQNRKCASPSTTDEGVPQRFIKLLEVKALTTLSTSEIYRRIARGTFPKQILLGPKSAVWIEAEVLAWQLEHISSRNAAPASGSA